jgi:hypothetical protein
MFLLLWESLMMPVWLNCNKKEKKKTNTLDDKETFL